MTSQRVNATDTIAAILDRQPRAARIFIRLGMQCVGCAMARFETLAEACATYGIAPEALLTALNAPKGKRQGASRRSRVQVRSKPR